MDNINKNLKVLTLFYLLFICMACSSATVDSFGEEITGGDPLDEMNAGQFVGGTFRTDDSLGGEMTAGEMTGGEMTGGEMTGGEMTGGEMTGGEMTAGEMTAGEITAGEMTAGEPVSEWVGMCREWQRIESNLDTFSWNGQTNQCLAGEASAESLNQALALTNFYRSLADLNPVLLNTSRSSSLQECALMMEANGRLSHSPPESWNCFTNEGAQLASRSNLAGADLIDAMGMYMVDPGNETTMGHRRWIMSIGLESVGFGSTSNYSCMEVLHLNRPQGWVAFPSPGPFPIQLSQDRWRRSFDQTGWTFQYDGFSLPNPQATVTMYDLPDPDGDVVGEGVDLPVELVSLRPNFGSANALNLIPQSWRSEVGKRYVVQIIADTQTIQYEVDMVDCNQVP